jgi:hypothetical protein
MLDLARTGAFAGRKHELHELEDRWASLAEEGPWFVGIAGEPGIGKTRLTSEFATAVHAAGATVLAGRCSEEPMRPFEPFAEALVAYARSSAVDDMVVRLGRLAEPLGALVPDLVGPKELVASSRRPMGSLESADERALLFDAVTSLLTEIATQGPVLLVLEDLHWATQPTLLLLRHLLQPVQPSALMIIGTYRDTELDRMHPLAAALADLSRAPNVDRSTLHGLDEDAIAECIGSDEEIDATTSLARILREQTDGNPFFVHELIRHLGDPGDHDKLPEGVREVIGRRLSRMPEGVNRALRAASVVGATFDLALLEAVPAAADDADDLLDALDLAVDASLLAEERGRPGGYAFTHALVRQTLYEEMTSARRARLHGQVLDAITDVYGEGDTWLASLAHHAAEAARTGSCERSVELALRAARSARARQAPEEARQIVERGLQVLELESEPRPAWEAKLRLEGSESLWHTDSEAALAELELVLTLARDGGDVETFARAADYLANWYGSVGRPDERVVSLLEEALAAVGDGDENVALRVELLSDLAGYWADSGGRPDLAHELSDQALDLARGSDDPDALFFGPVLRYVLLWGEPVASRRHLLDEVSSLTADRFANDWERTSWVDFLRARQAVEVGDPDFRTAVLALTDRQLGGSSDGYAHGFLALMDGDFASAEEANQDGLAGSTQGDMQSIGLAQLFLLRREQGRVAELEAVAEVAIAATPGLRAFEAAIALARAELGRRDEAAEMLDELAADDFGAVQWGIGKPVALGVLAELIARLDDDARADRILQMLTPYAGSLIIAGSIACCIGAADRGLGQLAAVLERWPEAESHFQAALALEERMQAPPLVARTRYWYADMLLRRDEDDDTIRAGALLEDVRATADELGMSTLAAEASALSATCGG